MGEFLTNESSPFENNILVNIRDLAVERAKFDNFDDTIKFIKENNISSDNLYVDIRWAVIFLFTNYDNEDIELLMLVDTVANGDFITDIIPKELLELLNIDTLLKLLTICNGNKAIDPEFKDTKKYIQAELKYRL